MKSEFFFMSSKFNSTLTSSQNYYSDDTVYKPRSIHTDVAVLTWNKSNGAKYKKSHIINDNIHTAIPL